MSTGHPVPPRDPPPGWRLVAVPAKDWRALTPGVKRCRWTGGIGRQHCRRPAVAELNRKIRPRNAFRSSPLADCWWAYCETHTNGYGRWVVGDRVLEWHLVEGEETA